MNTRPYNPLVFGYSLVVSAATLFLIFMGGLVTSTGSGLSVPDWPLSFGQIFPPMIGGVVFEHSHRLVATGVGLLTIGLIVILMRKEEDSLPRRAGWMALVLILLQGTLGGLTVLLGLPPIVSILHACLGQAFFCLVIAISVWTSPFWKEPATRRPPAGDKPPLHVLSLFLTVLVFFQLILGASIRHGGHGLNEHMAVGIGVAVFVHVIFRRVRRACRGAVDDCAREFKVVALALLAVTDFQILLGVTSYFLLYTKTRYMVPSFIPITMVTIHVMVGALLLATSVVFNLMATRGKPLITETL